MNIMAIAIALTSAVAYGLGSALQAKSGKDHPITSDATATRESEFKQTISAMFQPLFIVGTLCDIAGFLANTAADKMAPLFLVQPIMATNLLFAIIFGVFILHTKISARSGLAIFLILCGLIALGATASHEGHQQGPPYFTWYVLAASIILVIIGVLCTDIASHTAMIFVSINTGLLYGIVAIAVRLAPSSPRDLLVSPTLATIIIAGGGAFYLYTTAISQSSITTVLSCITLGETVLPAIIGLTLLGDTIIAHLGFVTVIGFIVAIAGIMLLLRSTDSIPQ